MRDESGSRAPPSVLIFFCGGEACSISEWRFRLSGARVLLDSGLGGKDESLDLESGQLRVSICGAAWTLLSRQSTRNCRLSHA